MIRVARRVCVLALAVLVTGCTTQSETEPLPFHGSFTAISCVGHPTTCTWEPAMYVGFQPSAAGKTVTITLTPDSTDYSYVTGIYDGSTLIYYPGNSERGPTTFSYVTQSTNVHFFAPGISDATVGAKVTIDIVEEP